jgi:hypothetical protein
MTAKVKMTETKSLRMKGSLGLVWDQLGKNGDNKPVHWVSPVRFIE